MKHLSSIRKIVLFGIAIGLIFHFLLVTHAYWSLKSKIVQSKFGEIVFRDDPSIGILFTLRPDDNNQLSKRRLEEAIVWRHLVNLKVIDWDMTKEDISKKLGETLKSTLTIEYLKKTTTLEHVVDISQKLALRHDGADFKEELVNLLAANMANGPRALEHYKNAVQSRSTSYAYFENPLAFLTPRELSFLWGEKSSQGSVLNLLFIHTGVAPEFDALPNPTPSYKDDNYLEPSQVYRQINEYFQRILITIHDDPEVIAARNWFTIVEGPEQFLMYCVFGVGVAILMLHYKGLISQKNDKFSLVLYKWIQIALPSLGFIGTKRGLSEALSRADSIVRAGSPINQSLAVSHVSETMGVAFTSTLVGLVLLMILMIFELVIKRRDLTWNE